MRFNGGGRWRDLPSIITHIDNKFYSLLDLCFYTDGQTGRQTDGRIDSSVDADSEYIQFIGSEMPPSGCYAETRSD